jgi:DNA-3-methyladenine glycosylase
MRLKNEFYRQPTLKVAKALLGKRLVRRFPNGIVSGWIVEVEAYLWRGDEACHANRGMTKRNETMFGRSGLLYVYPIHAKYCMNVVTEVEGRGAAVLIRAIEPIDGLGIMRDFRGIADLEQLTNGPGKLCSAFGIDRHFNGIDLIDHEDVWIEDDSKIFSGNKLRVHRSGRIGISRAQEKLWRFFIDGNRFVSGRVADHRVPRAESLRQLANLD